MAFIGKLLVVVHSALALGVLAWAIGVYTQRIDWNTPPTQAGKDAPPPGLFDRQKEQAAKYSAAVDRAYTRWSGNLFQVQTLEAERFPRRAFYKNDLEVIRTGKLNGKSVTNPVRELVMAPNGYIDIRPNAPRNPVEVRPGIPADSIANYITKMDQIRQDIAASQVKNAKAIEERDKLNDDIIGHMQPTLKKGLRTLLLEQIGFRERAEREEMYVDGFFTNREAEFGLLKKRRDAMNDRIEELKKWISAGRPS
jgi:hypothetical protein